MQQVKLLTLLTLTLNTITPCSLLTLSLPAQATNHVDSKTNLNVDEDEDPEENDDEDDEEKTYPNFIELGFLHQHESSYKLGEYNGFSDQGTKLLGNFLIRDRATYDSDSSNYWTISGNDIGLDSRSVFGEYAEQGKYRVFIHYDQIPHLRFDDASTPFIEADNNLYILPTDWVSDFTVSGMTQLQNSLQSINIETVRKNYTGGFSWHVNEDWLFKVSLSHETKKGTDTIAGIFGTSGFDPLAAILPLPIDQETDTIDTRLAYSTSQTQYELRYYLSMYDNRYDSLIWQSPYQRFPNTTSYPDAQGRISLAPDNYAQQFSFAFGHRLTAKNRLSGKFSYGTMRQDENFLPYTINSNLSVTNPLPNNDADARVNTLQAYLNYSSRLSKKMDFKTRYTFDERDNKTSSNAYAILRNDSEDQLTSLTGNNIRYNIPYSYKRHKLNAAVGYRLMPRTKLSLDYDHKYMQRDNSLVDNTTEQSVKFKINHTALTNINGWIAYELGYRDSDDYQGNSLFLQNHTQEYIATLSPELRFENDPYLRIYSVADRHRKKLSGAATYLVSEQVSLGLSGNYTIDDYRSVAVGLDESNQYSTTLDINYSTDEALTFYHFLTREQFNSEQEGFRRFSAQEALEPRDPGFAWEISNKDVIYTAGVGLDWTIIEDKWSASIDYAYSTADTTIKPKAGSNLSVAELPDIKTKLHSFSLSSDYQMQNNLRFRFNYRYEYYQSDDFALDGIEPDTLFNVIGLGNNSPDYHANIFSLSMIYTF